MKRSVQEEIDASNQEFWNELCGSTFAQVYGIKDHSLSSLEKFDYFYYRYYPYLHRHVPIEIMKGKKVLEVGLGYGTVGLKIARAGANYTGLDIAAGPVKMMQHRLKLYHLDGQAIQGSMLNCPLPDESQDFVVSIGCFHHTGNVQRCIDEAYRVLKPGGEAFIMVYNQFSYKQWKRWPKKTFRAWLDHFSKEDSSVDQRAAYDLNLSGKEAPETVFLSIYELKKMFAKYAKVRFCKENCDDPGGVYRYFLRRRPLLPLLGRAMGLDIYIRAKK